jgi:methionyl-tRNA synthetase
MDYITWDDFAKVDIRVGTIIEASVPEGSQKLVKYQVDFGDPPVGGGVKTIFSGISKWFGVDDLVGVQTTFVINLAPKKMGDLGESEGMLFAAEQEGRPVLVTFAEPLTNGTRMI